MLVNQMLSKPLESIAGWSTAGRISKCILRILVDFSQDEFLSLAESMGSMQSTSHQVTSWFTYGMLPLLVYVVENFSHLVAVVIKLALVNESLFC